MAVGISQEYKTQSVLFEKIVGDSKTRKLIDTHGQEYTHTTHDVATWEVLYQIW